MTQKYKKRKRIVWIVVLLFCMAGCTNKPKETVSGTNYYYPQKEIQQKEESELSVMEEQTTEHYLIISNDMVSEQMLLKQMESGIYEVLSYSVSTRFLDKYGNNTSVSYFDSGRVVVITKKDANEKIEEMKISADVWEYESVIRYEIDEERQVFQIADSKYSYKEDLLVVSNGKMMTLSELKEEDELRVIGMNKEILSVSVTTGQGTISLENTELFEGSFIQIGRKIFAEITGEIQMQVPEGTYTVTVANKGYGGSKEIEVFRDTVTVLDLDELKGEGPKKGTIQFQLQTEDENEAAEIQFWIDEQEVADREAVELDYGIHSIEAKAEGYHTYKKKLFVNSSEAVITIVLEEDTTVLEEEVEEEEVNSAEEEDSDTNEQLAGSVAGSLTTDQTQETSDANEREEELTADYLSTLMELLGNVMN